MRVCVCTCASSVLLQDEVLQLVGRAQQEGGRLSVAGDQLPHGRDLRLAELSGGPASSGPSGPAPSTGTADPSAQAVGRGGGEGVGHVGRGQRLHAEVSRACKGERGEGAS